MEILTDNFLRNLSVIPLLLAALYLLSLVAVTQARGVAVTLLKTRIIFTLLFSLLCILHWTDLA